MAPECPAYSCNVQVTSKARSGGSKAKKSSRKKKASIRSTLSWSMDTAALDPSQGHNALPSFEDLVMVCPVAWPTALARWKPHGSLVMQGQALDPAAVRSPSPHHCSLFKIVATTSNPWTCTLDYAHASG